MHLETLRRRLATDIVNRLDQPRRKGESRSDAVVEIISTARLTIRNPQILATNIVKCLDAENDGKCREDRLYDFLCRNEQDKQGLSAAVHADPEVRPNLRQSNITSVGRVW